MKQPDLAPSDSYRARMDRALGAEPSMGGLNAQPLVRDQALAIDGRTEDDFPAGSEFKRMGSADHLGPQFDPLVTEREVTPGEVPAVHGPDKTAWYGKNPQGDDDDGQ